MNEAKKKETMKFPLVLRDPGRCLKCQGFNKCRTPDFCLSYGVFIANKKELLV